MNVYHYNLETNINFKSRYDEILKSSHCLYNEIKVTGIVFNDLNEAKYYYSEGKRYSNKEEWFSVLTQEQKENYIWSL